jgi:hypothetical protein
MLSRKKSRAFPGKSITSFDVVQMIGKEKQRISCELFTWMHVLIWTENERKVKEDRRKEKCSAFEQ